MAWAGLRGMPQARADYLSGQICAVLANIHRAKDARVFEPGDFLPKLETEEQEEAGTEEIVLIDVEANSKALEQMLSRKE